MSDRLALANAIEDAGIPRDSGIGDRLDAALDRFECRLTTRLGALIIVVNVALFAALRYWPPPGR